MHTFSMHTFSSTMHLLELIEDADVGNLYDQPPHEYVEYAEEEFENEGFDAVPWGAIAMRAWEMVEEERIAEGA